MAGGHASSGRFKVTGVDCERFWLWKHTPVVRYDIVDERKADYETDPPANYFRQAAQTARLRPQGAGVGIPSTAAPRILERLTVEGIEWHRTGRIYRLLRRIARC